MVNDRLPDGGLVPGGPALYCARVALALEANVDVVTHLPAGYPREPLDGVRVVGPVVEAYPVFENTYDGLDRTQVMKGKSLPLDKMLEDHAIPCDLLICAPIYRELTRWPSWAPAARAISLQGVLRDRDATGAVFPRADAISAALRFAVPGAIALFSEEDCADPVGLALALARSGMIVALTHGDHGASLFQGGDRRDFPALPAGPVVDPTGAGDCFGTAFAVRYAETHDPEEAMDWGRAAGAIAVEREGLMAAATRDELRQRLAGRAA